MLHAAAAMALCLVFFCQSAGAQPAQTSNSVNNEQEAVLPESADKARECAVEKPLPGELYVPPQPTFDGRVTFKYRGRHRPAEVVYLRHGPAPRVVFGIIDGALASLFAIPSVALGALTANEARRTLRGRGDEGWIVPGVIVTMVFTSLTALFTWRTYANIREFRAWRQERDLHKAWSLGYSVVDPWARRQLTDIDRRSRRDTNLETPRRRW